MKNLLLLITISALAITIAIAGTYPAAERTEDLATQPGVAKPLVTLTGRTSDFETAQYRLVRSQEVFDEIWIAHEGDRVNRAAQGWPMTPQISFADCDVLLLFGGERTNCNGYRVEEILEEDDAVTVRIDLITYQTASFDGPDLGDSARPWALVVLPATKKTIFLEENVQGIIGDPPIWKQRAVFPGPIGIGRPVGGASQTGG